MTKNSGVRQIAAGFGLFSMAFIALGSLLAGARPVTCVIRGVEGAAVFGLLAWAVGSAIVSVCFMETKTEAEPADRAAGPDSGLKME